MNIDAAISEVVRSGNCSGCGACLLLDSALSMEPDSRGFLRPVRDGDTRPAPAREFDQVCPGRIVRSQNPRYSKRHLTMGPVIDAWAAWATDPDIRFAGSSGGVLTALSEWLVRTGEYEDMKATCAGTDPRRSVPISITSRSEALASAGSRYAPVAAASAARDGATALTVKPCEASALRALADLRSDRAPLLLSFFCAGTPSQLATDEVLHSLGVTESVVLQEMRYRGRGWPGRFTAVRDTGEEVSMNYESSWGQILGKDLQWRCKICPDGVGESADISAADYWRADDNGYPVFANGDGVSALIARTERGADVVGRAIEAGVLEVEPLVLGDLAQVQPLQRDRRRTLLGRLGGVRAAGGTTPSYRGFHLLQLALRRPRANVSAARGTFRRRRARE